MERFDLILGSPEANGARTVRREAVRAVVFRDDHILMMLTNKGDYKCPGGGVEGEERREDALRREIREETGYTITRILGEAGGVFHKDVDIYDPNAVFEEASRYYLCEVSRQASAQRLDDYEAALGFTPVWMKLDDAIAANEALLSENDPGINPWVYKETCVLKELRKRKG